jgi:hypothetical protein
MTETNTNFVKAQKLYEEIEKIVLDSGCDFLTLKKLTSPTSRISGNWTYGIQISSPFSFYQHRDNLRIHRIWRTEDSIINGVKRYVNGMKEEFDFIKPYLDYFSDDYTVVSDGSKVQFGNSSSVKITFVNKKTGRKYLFSEIGKNKLNLFENGYSLSRIGEIKPQEDVKMNRNPEFLIYLKHFEEVPDFKELKHLMQEESFVDTKDYFVF